MSHDRARDLRRRATDIERILWQRLRSRGISGVKFRRQVPIGSYIVDFLCAEAKLIVELDGGQHATETPERQRYLESIGFAVLRFWNNEALENLEGVLTTIANAVDERLDRRDH